LQKSIDPPDKIVVENIFPRYVRCSFIPRQEKPRAAIHSVADVYYLCSAGLGERFSVPRHLICNCDLLRVERLQNINYRNLILAGYTALRNVLAVELGCRNSEIKFETDAGGKPLISGNPFFFNVSHSRNGFAFAVTRDAGVGIDLEEMNRKINFEPIIRRFFGCREAAYIERKKQLSASRFFLLWTRKESLLKLLGTGLSEDLTHIEVFSRVNFIDRNSYSGLEKVHVPDNCYIYSARIGESYISVSLQAPCNIRFHHVERTEFEQGWLKED
jgi:phosphopantetheinyl transferase